MKIEELKNALNQGDRFQKVLPLITQDLITEELFLVFCELLNDEDSRNRFFAVYVLIDKFSSFLRDADYPLIDKFYELLFDSDGPIIDRSIWALSIIGSEALDKLIVEYQKGSILTKIRITYSVGRGNYQYREGDKINLLLDGLASEDDELRYTAMCEIMPNTPLWNRFGIESEGENNIDYEEIYKLILSASVGFVNSKNVERRDFSLRYIEMIKKELN